MLTQDRAQLQGHVVAYMLFLAPLYCFPGKKVLKGTLKQGSLRLKLFQSAQKPAAVAPASTSVSKPRDEYSSNQG